MRFDDMLATLLARPLDTVAARSATWLQIVDILSHQRGGADAAAGYALLRRVRADVPRATRMLAARSLIGRSVPEALVRLFADEVPAIAAPVLTGVDLPAAGWIALLPELGPTARGMVRHRRDLAPQVVQALQAFGPVDLVVGGPSESMVEVQPFGLAPIGEADEAVAPIGGGEAQIRDLVARIDAFRRRKPHAGVPAPIVDEPDEGELRDEPRAEPRATAFRFETGADGVLTWVDGAPREALVGETLALAAAGRDHGVDGQVAGAFRQRAPFRDGRLSVASEGPAGGEWRISAVPFFDPAGGRFTGYRGTARRPRADETAAPASSRSAMPGIGFAPDSLRQLVHELRTPINAIVGFAEMIEGQVLGPATSLYRDRARDIAAEGRRLIDAVDDLDAAARIESARWDPRGSVTEPAFILERLHDAHEALAGARGVELRLRIAGAVPPVAADAVAVERMFGRLLASAIAVASPGETVTAMLVAEGATVLFALDRPQALAGRDEAALLDPGYSPDGDWPDAPLLGLGFALRLVRNIADSAHGSLSIGDECFLLRLPSEGGSARGEEERQG